ncbi:unnamed protein product [Brassica napus]|uniref:Bet v I/Major latex protein domain-containing protein n=2 Tax=Brassica TaxID=3705 RepID=M4D7F4_BRACM|nr:unnamed protein product [Brassica napus]
MGLSGVLHVEVEVKSPAEKFWVALGDGSPLVKVSAERIETVDLENKSMTYSIIGGEMLEYYKTFKGTITVTPKGGGSILKWSAEFEKTGHEIEDPHVIKDFAVKNFKEIDEYLLKQSSV